MSETETQRFLAEPRIARAASNSPDGFPYLVATWYLYEGGKLFFFCGRAAPRASALEEDPRMVFLIDDDHYPYKHVTICGTGRVEESDSRAAEYIERICTRYLGPDAGLKYAESLKESIDPVLITVEVSKLISWDYHTGGYRTKPQGRRPGGKSGTDG